jgi:predicted  nucleic acid-binding Zn-ribbon protein
MLKSLKVILEIQEYDVKMIRLMRLKNERKYELDNIESLHTDLTTQLDEKKAELLDVNKNIQIQELKIREIKDKLKKLDAKQGSIKKVDEFNALTQEMTSMERSRVTSEQIASDLIDKKDHEEEILKKIKESLVTTEESSAGLKEKIYSSLKMINEEGKKLKEQRDILSASSDPDILRIYERLLKNKKDRVIVPIETRTCTGCHIALTAQHENLVRKGERLVFCEHCSRILYWQESEELEGTALAPKRRRRRTTKT